MAIAFVIVEAVAVAVMIWVTIYRGLPYSVVVGSRADPTREWTTRLTAVRDGVAGVSFQRGLEESGGGCPNLV